jgi:hypothetical protein
LTQQVPSGALDSGWLLELELPDADVRAGQRQLAEALTDMRLLGFAPTLLAPLDAPIRFPARSLTNGQGR